MEQHSTNHPNNKWLSLKASTTLSVQRAVPELLYSLSEGEEWYQAQRRPNAKYFGFDRSSAESESGSSDWNSKRPLRDPQLQEHDFDQRQSEIVHDVGKGIWRDRSMYVGCNVRTTTCFARETKSGLRESSITNLICHSSWALHQALVRAHSMTRMAMGGLMASYLPLSWKITTTDAQAPKIVAWYSAAVVST